MADDNTIESTLVTLAGQNSTISALSPTIQVWCDGSKTPSKLMLAFKSSSSPNIYSANGAVTTWKADCTAMIASAIDDDPDADDACALQAAVQTFLQGITKSSFGTSISATCDYIGLNDTQASMDEGYHMREISFSIWYS